MGHPGCVVVCGRSSEGARHPGGLGPRVSPWLVSDLPPGDHGFEGVCRGGLSIGNAMLSRYEVEAVRCTRLLYFCRFTWDRESKFRTDG